MVFTLYKADNSQVWTETQSGVPVTKGVYNVLLGSVVSLATIPFDVQYFLGIKVGSDAEMSPRQALASVPYALKAGTAESVSDGAVTAQKLGITCPDGQYMQFSNPAGWSCSAGTAGPQGPAGPSGPQGP